MPTKLGCGELDQQFEAKAAKVRKEYLAAVLEIHASEANGNQHAHHSRRHSHPLYHMESSRAVLADGAAQGACRASCEAGVSAGRGNAKVEIGGAAGPGLKSKPGLDLGEFRLARTE